MLDWKHASEVLPPLDTWVMTYYEGSYLPATLSRSAYHRPHSPDSWYEDFVPAGKRKNYWDNQMGWPLDANSKLWWALLNHPPGVSDDDVRMSHEDEDEEEED